MGGGRQGPIESLLPSQVEVTELGNLDYEEAERGHKKPMEPMVDHLVEECNQGHRHRAVARIGSTRDL